MDYTGKIASCVEAGDAGEVKDLVEKASDC